MAFYTPVIGGSGGDDELTSAEELFVQGLEQLSYSENDLLAFVAGSLANRTPAQIRSILNIEDGATADQSDSEIATAYNNEVAVVSQGVAEAGTETTVYRWTPQRVAQAIAALAGSSSTNNYSATSDPTANDDTGDGYTIGSVWVNIVSNESFKCVDNTLSSAVWVKTSLTTDDLATVAITGAYSDLTGTPTIPTNNNQLTNGAGYITTYTVTEGDVTTHQAALSITESQISDLGTYLESVDIANINATGTPGSGNFLRGDGVWAAATGAEQLSDLSDITITTVADNEVLAYDSGSGEWINQTPAEAGLAAASHNHTASEITDFDTEVANNSAVSANTAKVTNATHTGDVTGSTTLTIADEAVTFAKMQHVPTNRILGRSTAGMGDIEALTDGDARIIMGLANTDSPQFGGLDINGSITTDAIQMTRTANNLTSVSSAQILGSSTTTYAIRTAGSSGIVGDNRNFFELLLAQPSVTTGSAGTHPIFGSLGVKAPAITIDGGAVTNAASIYIEDAPTGASNNYALWVDAGTTRLDGDVEVGGTVDGRDVAADGTKLDGIETGATANTGDVVKVGTPANNQLAIWTGDGTLEGTSKVTFDSASDLFLIDGTNELLETRQSVNGVSVSFKNVNTNSSSSGAGLAAYQDGGAAISNGDRLGYFLFGGATNASGSLDNSAGVFAFATEDWSGSAQGTELQWQITPTGSGSRQTQITFDGDGINLASGNTFRINGTEHLSATPTNVANAGALMDSELASISSVKALDQGVATTDSPQFASINLGHATDTTISRVSAGVIAVEGNNVQLEPSEGGFVDGDKTKLDGIETGADVTDAAGISTAGGMITVEHGATAGTARPSVSGPVYWIGSVEPTNADDGDVWVDTA